jgi:hypothetical protein
MDINLKSKDIIKKQLEKYSSREWEKYFNVILETESYQSILKNLIHQVTQGNRFRPSIKDLFNYTEGRHPDDVQVVMICDKSIFPIENHGNLLCIDPDPIQFDTEIDWDTDKLYDMWQSDKPVWVEHMHEIIKYLDKSDITFVFESNKYKNYIGAVKQGNVCIIPNKSNSIYKTNYHAIWHRIVKNIK